MTEFVFDISYLILTFIFLVAYNNIYEISKYKLAFGYWFIFEHKI